MVRMDLGIRDKNTLEIMMSSVHRINVFLTSTCLFTDDVNFDHLANVVAVRLFHYKSILPFVLKTDGLGGAGYSETTQISYF